MATYRSQPTSEGTPPGCWYNAQTAEEAMWVESFEPHRDPTAYEVTAYRGKRNWYLKIADYRKTVSDSDGKPPAREQAETLRTELIERSARSRLGWIHIDIQPKREETR